MGVSLLRRRIMPRDGSSDTENSDAGNPTLSSNGWKSDDRCALVPCAIIVRRELRDRSLLFSCCYRGVRGGASDVRRVSISNTAPRISFPVAARLAPLMKLVQRIRCGYLVMWRPGAHHAGGRRIERLQSSPVRARETTTGFWKVRWNLTRRLSGNRHPAIS